MRRHHDGDAELAAGALDEREHLFTACGIEAVRRLVEQQQLGIVHERLRELDALLHARRVAADQPIPLLVQPDVPQHLGGALAGGGERKPDICPMCVTKSVPLTSSGRQSCSGM